MKKQTKITIAILAIIVLLGSITGGVMLYKFFQPIEIEVFDYLTIEQIGGNNEVEVETKIADIASVKTKISKEASKRLTLFLQDFQPTQDKTKDLTNGDVVTFKFENAEELTTKYGIKPLNNEYEYVVKDAPTVPRKWADFVDFQSSMLSKSYALMESMQTNAMQLENNNTQTKFGKDIMSGFNLIGIEVYELKEESQKPCVLTPADKSFVYGCGQIILLFQYEANLVGDLYYTTENSFYGISEFVGVYKTIDGELKYEHPSNQNEKSLRFNQEAKEILEEYNYQSTGIFINI